MFLISVEKTVINNWWSGVTFCSQINNSTNSYRKLLCLPPQSDNCHLLHKQGLEAGGKKFRAQVNLIHNHKPENGFLATSGSWILPDHT